MKRGKHKWTQMSESTRAGNKRTGEMGTYVVIEAVSETCQLFELFLQKKLQVVEYCKHVSEHR